MSMRYQKDVLNRNMHDPNIALTLPRCPVDTLDTLYSYDAQGIHYTRLIPYFQTFFLTLPITRGALAPKNWETTHPPQGSRKLVPLVLPVPDKPHLVGQNEI